MKKRLLFAVPCLILFQSCSLQKSSENPKEKTKDYGLIDNNQRKLKSIHSKDLEKKILYLTKETNSATSWNDYVKWEEHVNELYAPLENNLNFLTIQNYLEPNNQKVIQQLNENTDLLNKVEQEIKELYRIHMQKNYGQQVLNDLENENKKLLIEIQKTETPEKKELLQQLKDQLYTVQNEYSQKQYLQETTFEGKTYAIHQLNNEKNKAAIEKKYYQELLDIYKKQITIEKEIATLLGYASVPEMYHIEYNRPYTQKNVDDYFMFIKKYYTPILDYVSYTGGDEKTKSPVATIIKNDIGSIFKESNQDLYTIWNLMLEKHLYDISPSESKPQNWAAIIGNHPPFLLGNFDDTNDSLQTFIHEFGHFFADTMQRENRIANNDIEEIYSQALEALMSYKLNSFTTDAKMIFLERIYVNQILAMSMMQEFQTLLYEEENLTLEKMTELDKKLNKEYFQSEENLSFYNWAENLSPSRPLGNMEYFLGAVTAVQIHQKAQEDYDAAFKTYMNMVKNPNQKDIFQIITDSGLQDPTNETTLQSTAEYLTTLFNSNKR